MKIRNLPFVGGIVSAIATSLCCIGPLPVAILGVTAVGSDFIGAMKPYRPYFMTLTALLLGYAWWSTLRSRSGRLPLVVK